LLVQAAERDDYLVALQRERAEFQNFKRRTAEQREATLGLAAEGLIRKVLNLADDFDRAIEWRIWRTTRQSCSRDITVCSKLVACYCLSIFD